MNKPGNYFLHDHFVVVDVKRDGLAQEIATPAVSVSSFTPESCWMFAAERLSPIRPS